MNTELMLEHLDRLCERASSVRKVREIVLESAIRGRLVVQDNSERPAAELLRTVKTLQAKRAQRLNVAAPSDAEAWFQIPVGWEWTRLGETGRLFNGDSVSEAGKAELAKVAIGLPFVATKDIGYGSETIGYENGLRVKAGDTRFKVAHANSVLICAEGGSAGRKIALTDRDICFGNKLYANETWPGIDPRYVYYVYQSPSFYRAFAAKMTGIIGGISRSELLHLAFPLPPSAEQKRIVAKVEELMALCDRLEAQLKQRDEQAGVLAKAAVARFQADPTVENLEYLFHRDFAVQSTALRDSIVDLALRGKLGCPLPSNGVSASDCWRVGAVRSGAASDNASAPLKPEESPWRIPPSWTWLRLGTVANIKHGYAFSSVFFTTERTGHVLTTPGNFFESGGFRDRGAGTKYFRGEVPPEFVLRAGDLIVPMTEQAAGLLGSPAFVPDDGRTYLHNQRLGKLELYSDQVSLEYLFWFFNSRYFRGELARTCTGMKVRHTSPKRILSVLLALPPLAEQRRIVAKVNELMALVDQLESQITASEEAGTKLLDALVAELAPSN